MDDQRTFRPLSAAGRIRASLCQETLEDGQRTPRGRRIEGTTGGAITPTGSADPPTTPRRRSLEMEPERLFRSQDDAFWRNKIRRGPALHITTRRLRRTGE